MHGFAFALQRATGYRVHVSSLCRPQFVIGRCALSSLSAEQEARMKRILYRCKQRGLLELDLIMGAFATKQIRQLGQQDLDDLEKLSLCETPDVMQWILKQQPV